MPSTAITAATAATTDLDTYRKAAAKTRESVQSVGREPFLKMGKDGIWVFGKDNIEVEDGSRWAIHPGHFRLGFTCWTRFADIGLEKKDVKLGMVMVGLGADPIDPGTLTEHVDKDSGTIWEWVPCRELKLLCISGEDTGALVEYNVSSQGGCDVIEEWFGKFEERLMGDDDTIVAVVMLSHETYEHSRWGKTYKPSFTYSDWSGLSDTPAAVEQAKPDAVSEQQAEALENTQKADRKATKKAEKKTAKALKKAAEREERAAQTVDDAKDGKGDAPAPTRRRRRPAPA